MMKKTVSLLIMICLLCFTSGCSTFNEEEYIKEVLGYISDKKTENLKSMFCDIISDLDNLDEQIQEAFNFFAGDIISYDSPQGGSGKKSERRKVVLYDISPYIANIETASGKIYEIRFYSDIVNDKNKNRVGISEITITNEDGEECRIGDFYLVNPEKK